MYFPITIFMNCYYPSLCTDVFFFLQRSAEHQSCARCHSILRGFYFHLRVWSTLASYADILLARHALLPNVPKECLRRRLGPPWSTLALVASSPATGLQTKSFFPAFLFLMSDKCYRHFGIFKERIVSFLLFWSDK